MSLTNPIPRGTRDVTLTTAAGQTVFGPLSYLLYDAADLEIEVRLPGLETAGPVDAAGYAVTPAAPAIAFPAYFMVTLAAAYPTGSELTIRGVRVPERSTDVTRGGVLQSQAIERELDKITVVGQELRRDIGREAGLLQSELDALRDLIGSGAAIGMPIFASRAAAAVQGISAAATACITLGYALRGDGGGSLDTAGTYVRVAAEPVHAAKFRSADRFLPDGTTSAGNGGWWELRVRRISLLQLGADPSFAAFSDTAVAALAAYLTARPECRDVLAPAGRYKIYPRTVPASNIDPLLVLQGAAFAGLRIDGSAATFVIDMPNYDDPVYSDLSKANFGSICRFIDIPGLHVACNFEGDLSAALVNSAQSPIGFIGVVLLGKCDDAVIEGVATGIMSHCYSEASKDLYFEVDGTEPPMVDAGGAGYAQNDLVGFVKGAAYGASRNAVFQVSAIGPGGAVTSLTATDLGRFEYDTSGPGGYFGANAVPKIGIADVGFAATTLTGAGAGLKLRPFFRVGNRQMLPANQTFRVRANQCCRIATLSGAGAIAPRFFIDADHIQRGILLLNGVEGAVIRGRLRNSWLNTIELVHEVISPTDPDIDIDHEATEGFNTTGWFNNSSTITHDAQSAGPARFYGGRAVVRKSWPEKYTSNGQGVWYANAVSGAAGLVIEAQPRRHRIRDFDLHVTLAGSPSGGGVLVAGIVVGIPDPAFGWAPREAFDIRGFRVSGHLGATAVVSLPRASFLRELPDLASLSASNEAQILIDGQGIPQRLGGDPLRATEIDAGLGGTVTVVYKDDGINGPFFKTFHDSATPVSGDTIAWHLAEANNAAGARTSYAGYGARVTDTTIGSEDGYGFLLGKKNGTSYEPLRWSQGVFSSGASDLGTETLNMLSGVYYNGQLCWSGQDTTIPDARYLATSTGPYAPLNSPHLTGVPTTPTPAVDTNTTQIASAAFVLAQAAAATPLIDGTAAVGVSTRFARGDHVHPTDTTRAPLASPALTGVPTAPTAAVDTNNAQLANTAFVLAQAASATPLIDGAAAVGTSTRFARGDHVHPTDTTRAALVSPAFTTPNIGAAAGSSLNLTGNVVATGGASTFGPGGSGSGTIFLLLDGGTGSAGGAGVSFKKNGGNIFTLAHTSGISGGTQNDVGLYNWGLSAYAVTFGAADNSATFGGAVIHGKGSVAVANGLNSNIATPAKSFVRLTGPSAVFSIGGFTGGVDGYKLVLYNTAAFAMTIVNEDASSTAGNRIKTLTGANVTLRAGTSMAELIYDATDARWLLVATN